MGFVSSNSWRLIGGAIAAIFLLNHLYLSDGSRPHRSIRSSMRYGASWRFKIPSWAKSEVPQDRLGFMPLSEDVDAMCKHHHWTPYQDRFHRRKIYDLIMVNDELDALLIRMGEMDQVDYFVIVESDLTFSDKPKPLHVAENWDLFAEHHSRMILHTLNTTGQTFEDTWGREKFTRNSMFDQVFPLLQDEQIATHGDVIIVADVDEIIRPEVLTALRNCEIPKRVRFQTHLYYYSFQWMPSNGEHEWRHPEATYYDGLTDTIRPDDLRYGQADINVYSAGWSCSYCFSRLQDIVNKVKSFSHQEMNKPEFTTPSKILQRVRMGQDMFDRGQLFRIDNNKDVPGFVVRNAEQFRYMLDRDSDDGGFVDAWDLVDAGDEAGLLSV